MTSKDFYLFYQIMIYLISFFTLINLIAKTPVGYDIVNPVHFSKIILLCSFVVLTVAFFPVEYGSDKQNYYETFMSNNKISASSDIGWRYYVNLCKFLIDDSTVFFIITSTVYFIGNYLFLKALVPKKYLFYFLLTTFASLGYFSYGVNTMRAGLALSFFLIAFTKRQNIFYFALFCFLAVYIHKSILILVIALILTKYFSNSKLYILIWLSFLIISVLNIQSVTDFVKNVFFDVDERVNIYLTTGVNELYKTGFRTDFLLYSIIPIITGYYYIYKLKFENTSYTILYNVYLLSNSLWLLLIRLPYNDRFAYLSWFLFPFIILYPLFFLQYLNKRLTKIVMAIAGMVFINFILTINKL